MEKEYWIAKHIKLFFIVFLSALFSLFVVFGIGAIVEQSGFITEKSVISSLGNHFIGIGIFFVVIMVFSAPPLMSFLVLEFFEKTRKNPNNLTQIEIILIKNKDKIISAFTLISWVIYVLGLIAVGLYFI